MHSFCVLCEAHKSMRSNQKNNKKEREEKKTATGTNFDWCFVIGRNKPSVHTKWSCFWTNFITFKRMQRYIPCTTHDTVRIDQKIKHLSIVHLQSQKLSSRRFFFFSRLILLKNYSIIVYKSFRPRNSDNHSKRLKMRKRDRERGKNRRPLTLALTEFGHHFENGNRHR